MDGTTIVAVAALATLLLAVVGGMSAYFISRRNSSGEIKTSEAATLWQQSQAMREMLQAEKDKAENQRDSLITAYTNGIIPTLGSVNEGIKAIHELLSLADIGIKQIQEMQSLIYAKVTGSGDAK